MEGIMLCNWYECWVGGESWHDIEKLFNPPFLILEVRYSAVNGVYRMERDSRNGFSNDFKCYVHGYNNVTFPLKI